MIQKIVKNPGKKCLTVGHRWHKVKVVDTARRLEFDFLINVVPKLARKENLLNGGRRSELVIIVIIVVGLILEFFTFIFNLFTFILVFAFSLSYTGYLPHVRRFSRNIDAILIGGEFFKICVSQYFQIASREKFGVAKLFLVQKKVAVIIRTAGQPVFGSLITENIAICGTYRSGFDITIGGYVVPFCSRT